MGGVYYSGVYIHGLSSTKGVARPRLQPRSYTPEQRSQSHDGRTWPVRPEDWRPHGDWTSCAKTTSIKSNSIPSHAERVSENQVCTHTECECFRYAKSQKFARIRKNCWGHFRLCYDVEPQKPPSEQCLYRFNTGRAQAPQ